MTDPSDPTPPRLNRAYRTAVAVALALVAVGAAVATSGRSNGHPVGASRLSTVVPGLGAVPTLPGAAASGPAGTAPGSIPPGAGSAQASAGSGAGGVGGSGDSGGTAPAQLAAQASASDPGVHTTTVDVGFIILPSSQYTMYGATDQQEQKSITAIVDYVNSHGGIAGRKINPVVVGDNTPLSDSGGTAACNTLINSKHVFMVIDEGLPGGPDCVAHYGRPIVDTGYSSENNATNAELAADSPYYWITGVSTDTLVRQWLEFLSTSSYYGKGQRYGITDAPAHPGFKYAADLFQRLAPQYGINVVARFDASDDTSTAGLQCQQGLQKFKAAGVTVEVPFDNPVAIGFGMNCADSTNNNKTANGQKGKLTISSIGAMDSTSGASLYTSDADGMRGPTVNHIPTSKSNATCRSIITAQGIPFTTIQESYCETINLVATVFRRIPANQGVTASSWINQIARVRGLTLNATATLNFSPQQHAGSTSTLIEEYHGGANGYATEETGFQEHYR